MKRKLNVGNLLVVLWVMVVTSGFLYANIFNSKPILVFSAIVGLLPLAFFGLLVIWEFIFEEKE